ncbi:MAG: YeeE/YedE family protein [Gemmobacter sp.]
MTGFTPFLSLAGGVLIGIAAVLLMALHGRIAGMTGILEGAMPPLRPGRGWRAAFIAGSVAAVALLRGAGVDIPFESATPAPWLIAGGLIVGVGVYYGSGCTSGHGVCGMARLSPRSIAATLVFMLSTGVTVYLVRHVFGGF